MQSFTWLRKWMTGRCHTPSRTAPCRFRPQLEALEDRSLPSTYYAATASDLIADINAANKHGGANTIVLTAPTTSPYVLTAVNNTKDGPTGLPQISGKDDLSVVGNGDTIERDSGAPSFRLFDVAGGGSLTLQNLTLTNGQLWWGSGASAEGGAVFNQGTLVLSGVTVTGNRVSASPGATSNNKTGGAGADAAGGGIWSNGALTVENGCVITSNSATGGDGGFSYATAQYGPGGNAFGGGICVAGGTATITDSSIGTYYAFAGYGYGNTAQGGAGANVRSNGARSASGYGGGLYVAAGTVTMNADTVASNTAQGGTPSPQPGYSYPSGYGYGGGLYAAGGNVTLTNDTVGYNVAGTYENGGTSIFYVSGYGGGVFIASAARVYLDSYTVANTIANTDQSGMDGYTADIDGTYILLT
jgi:hypothetical protein